MKLLTVFPMGTQLYIAYEEGKLYTLAREGDVSSGALYWQELPDMPHYAGTDSASDPDAPQEEVAGVCGGCMFWQSDADARSDLVPVMEPRGVCLNEVASPSGGRGRGDVDASESCDLWHKRLTHGK
jgi:hypothetical protein